MNTYKVIEIDERKYHISRLNVKEVTYFITKFGSKILPIFNDFQSIQKTVTSMDADADMSKFVAGIDFKLISDALGMLTQEEIDELYKLVFSKVRIQASDDDTTFAQYLVLPDGSYTLEDLDYDIKLAFNILVEVVKVNVGFILGESH